MRSLQQIMQSQLNERNHVMITADKAIAQIRAQVEDLQAMETRLLDEGKRGLPDYEAGRLSAYKSAMAWLDESHARYLGYIV